ncbi:MAG TPA: hypothetical protein VHC49_25895 [Mycobacteriales bacterium]|nr:hypothetical protein [Mycobacteriales bacterium]
MTARRDFEAEFAQLVGRRLRRIRYWDIPHDAADPRIWDHGDWHHAVMGVELDTDAGPYFLTWSSRFYPYDVELFTGTAAEHLVLGPGGPEGWPVETNAHWVRRLAGPITGTAVHWLPIEFLEPPGGFTAEAPVGLRLDFEAGPAWLVAGLPGRGELADTFLMGDELLVLFAADRMGEIGLGGGPEVETSL